MEDVSREEEEGEAGAASSSPSKAAWVEVDRNKDTPGIDVEEFDFIYGEKCEKYNISAEDFVSNREAIQARLIEDFGKYMDLQRDRLPLIRALEAKLTALNLEEIGAKLDEFMYADTNNAASLYDRVILYGQMIFKPFAANDMQQCLEWSSMPLARNVLDAMDVLDEMKDTPRKEWYVRSLKDEIGRIKRRLFEERLDDDDDDDNGAGEGEEDGEDGEGVKRVAYGI